MPHCIVQGCRNSTRSSPGLTFHKFPKGNTMMWKRAIGQPNLKTTKYHVVCSVHFRENDYLVNYKTRRRLKPGAVPSILLPELHCKRKLEFLEPTVKSIPKRKATTSPLISLHSSSSEAENTTGLTVAHSQGIDQSIPGPSQVIVNRRRRPASSSSSSDMSSKRRRIKWMHAYSQSLSKYEKKIDTTKQQLTQVKNKLGACRQKVKRLQKNVHSLKGLVTFLRQNSKVSPDASAMLESTFSGIPLFIMKRLLTKIKRGKNVRTKYPNELRNFAMTLQFYSPKAYDYVRRSFNLCLPAPSVIRSWLSKIDCEPGYSQPALQMLQSVVHEKGSVLCSLIFDEMSIKKLIELEGNSLKTRGYVDVGTGAYDETSLATEALVLMVVCLNGSWKLPIAYFLINKLSAEEKAGIVQESLRVLHNTGVKIVSVTCDGPQVNFNMAKELGCKLTLEEGMITWFPHPSDGSEVFLLFDICHMIKLIRNNLARLGQIKNPNGDIIDWQFIEKLYCLQEQEAVKLANKLSKAYMEWKKHIMKVNLAVQTLSNSVAAALEFLKDHLKLPEFQGAGPTIEFIRITNNLFDLLNSRNPFAKGFKTSLKQANEDYWLPFLNHAVTYLWSCTNMEGVPLYRTKNKTPFVGFIISSLSVLSMYRKYVKEENLLKYLLTYKFSQDHLELFFCAIRSRNGFNNNPTCAQFVKTYRRLLVHYDLKSFGGNCTSQDNTNILTVLSTSDKQPTVKTMNISNVTNHRLYNVESIVSWPEEEFIEVMDISLDALVQNVVAYIAGFVVRSILKKLKCETCILALTTSNHTLPELQLIKLKSQGGLIYPSESVLKICKMVELNIRKIFMLCDNKPPPQDSLTNTLILNIGSDVLLNSSLFSTLNDHIFDQAIHETPHRKILVDNIIMGYTKVQFHSLVKKFNREMMGDPLRKRLTKLILFKHQ